MPTTSEYSIDPTHLADLRALFSRYDIRPQKRLGQNFLVSPGAADHIIQIAQVTSDAHVLEVGAGAGALTVRLARVASKVVAIELDDHLVNLLPDVLGEVTNTSILHADILKLDLSEIIGTQHWTALGNLPYYITGPTLAKLLECRHFLEKIVVMVQKEVADRIASPPGSREYGALTVMLQAYFHVKREFVVKRGSFFPVPEVDSAVISLTPLETPLVPADREDAFAAIVRAAFAHRRKTLENSLVDVGTVANRQQAVDALTAAELPLGRRAEALAVAEFVRLTDKIAL
jgi:16S rRNA (adenine1518-N6/adenine1519-N6)-dimethyltransferase